MKHISVVAGSILAVVIAASSFNGKLEAQEPGAIFTVPFAFTADGHNIGPGTYAIERDSTQFFISIRNLETGKKQVFSVRPEQQAKISSTGMLVFHRCGAREDLTEFHISGTNVYSATISQRRGKNSETERCPTAGTMTVAAR